MKGTIQIPASTSNFGPGFDCLGGAVQLYSTTTFQTEGTRTYSPETTPLTLNYSNSCTPDVPTEDNLIVQALRNVFTSFEKELPEIHLDITSRIPAGRGLGASAVAILTGTTIGLKLLAQRSSSTNLFSRSRILKHALQVESHLGNLSPSLLGGIRISYREDLQPASVQVPVENLPEIHLVVPSFEYTTEQARNRLPDTYSQEPIIHNLARTSLFIHALQTGNRTLLREGTADRMHEPHRIPDLPGGQAVPEAGLDHGAYAVWLSGAGPSFGCFVRDNDSKPAQAMKSEFEKNDVEARIIETSLDQNGLIIK